MDKLLSMFLNVHSCLRTIFPITSFAKKYALFSPKRSSHYAPLRRLRAVAARTNFTHFSLKSKLSTFQPAFDHARALTWLPSFSFSHHARYSYADDGSLSFNILS